VIEPARDRHIVAPPVFLLVMLVSALLAAPARAELDAGLNAVSRYVYRGIDMSGNDPALQGRVEYATAIGLYVGAWASSVTSSYDDRETEVDLFVGYQRRLHPALAVDATVIRYSYHGGGVDDRYDWTEAQFTAHVRDHWSITAAVADDWAGWPGTTWSIEGSWHYAPAPRWMLDATIGHNALDDVIGFNYQWAELGLTRQLGPLHARLGYSATSGAGLFGDLADDRWLLSLGWDLAR